MKNTTNVFLEGITTDLHPLTMPETALTSALNASIITFNGNELILQNDMGNTLIKDSITGNVMSLNDGFIPLGMKEHGGILYIASYNPSTKEGELGTIPSPIIHYNDYQVSNEEGDIAVADMQPTMDNPELDPKLNTNLIYISDHLFHCGDKFIVALNLNGIKNEYIRQPLNGEDEVYPIISKPGQKGWYKINLYAITDSGKEVPLDGVTSKVLECYNTEGVKLKNQYWFLDLSCLKDGEKIDEERTRQTNSFKTYPNIPSGRLAIRFEPELHEQLLYLDNTTYDAKLPALYFDNDKKCVLINGFTYEADCAILPGKIVVRCNNGNNEGLKLVVEHPNGKTEENSELTFYINNNIDNNSGLYLIKHFDPQHQSIPRYYLTRNETEFSTKNYDSACFRNKLFYIKIVYLNTDIYITVDLYVYTNDTDTNKKYVYYRTDHLPKYNPALASAGNDVILAWKQLYYEFGHEDSETYDVELFHNIGENDQRCFLYDDTPDKLILEYDSTLRKYRPRNEYHPEGALYKEIKEGDDRIHTLDHYMWLRTWIYPLCVTDMNNQHENTGEPDFIWNFLSRGNGNHFISTADFLKCSTKPVVLGKYCSDPSSLIDCEERNILLPIFASNDLITFSNCKTAQKTYFAELCNEAGLKPDDMPKNCLYYVNLNTLYSLTDSGEFLSSEHKKSPVDAWHDGNYGDDYGQSCQWGTENFFNWAQNLQSTHGIGNPTNHKPDELLTDFGLVFSRTLNHYDDDFYILHDNSINTILGVDKEYMPWKLKHSIEGYDDTNNCDYWEVSSMYHIYDNPYFSRTKYDFTVLLKNESCSEVIPGFVNTALSLCPGYFGNHYDLGSDTVNKSFQINLQLLKNYTYTSKYLYSTPLQIILRNFGLDFIKVCYLLYTPGTANMCTPSHNITINLDEQHGEQETRSVVKFPAEICKNIKLNEVGNNKFKSLIEEEKLCKILPWHLTYNYTINLTEHSFNEFLYNYGATKTEMQKIIRSLYQLIAAPQIFGYIPKGGLTRSYKADFEIATLIDLKDGLYIPEGNKENGAMLVISNINPDVNYLINSLALTIESEYISNLISSDLSLVNAPKNSFCGKKGYLLVGKNDKYFSKTGVALTKGYYVFSVNHNGCKTENGEYKSNVNLKLTISNSNNSITQTFTDPYFVAFCINNDGNYNFELRYYTSSGTEEYYIRNIGVYKIENITIPGISPNDSLNFESFDTFEFLDNTSGIIFDSVLCYHEIDSVNHNLGCLNLEFEGFKSLPERSYQRCVGYYQYNADMQQQDSLPKVSVVDNIKFNSELDKNAFSSKLGSEGINILRLSEL